MGRLDERVAIVTGGAGGIGSAVARLLTAEGADVVVTDVRDDEGAELAAELGGRSRYQRLDVTDEEAGNGRWPRWNRTWVPSRCW